MSLKYRSALFCTDKKRFQLPADFFSLYGLA